MIHMLSRFDLNDGRDPAEVLASYERFFELMRDLDLVVSTGKVGRRVSDTPMDTDKKDAPEYYVVMTFRDRDQLDASYDRLFLRDMPQEQIKMHAELYRAIKNHVFTCWED